MTPWQETYERKEGVSREKIAQEERWARRMCESGNFHEIITLLRSNPFVFERQKNRVLQSNSTTLEKATFLSTPDWEMLTVLELFDRDTFTHELRVFESIHEKVMSRREIGLFLRGRLRMEDVSVDDLLRAALHHDIGKITIPKEVLHDATSGEDWQLYAQARLSPEAYDRVEETLRENPTLREKDIVPFSCGASEKVMEMLRDHGFDPNHPLGTIIGRHADASGDILRSYGFAVAAEIAENHHNRPIHEERRPISISSFRASWILRAADIFDAIRSPREYKKERPIDAALAVLEEETSAGFIDPKLASLWIADEFRNSPH